MSAMFKQESSSALSPMAQSSSSLDPLDIDRYIDFDQAIYPSPSNSSSSSSPSRGKVIATPEFASGIPNNTFLPPQSSSQSTFAGPSHQYGLHKQQTGIPVGALSSTLAVNQPNAFPFGGYQIQQDYGAATVTDGYFGMNTVDDMFDFNTLPSHNPSFGTSVDTDMDFDSPTQDLFSLNDTQSTDNDFIDPNAVGGQEDISASSTPVQSNVGRLWPGMHQQQAAMAKAQAEQRQQSQQRVLRQPQSIAPPQPRQPATRPAASSSRPPTDPIVEERISRLLNQMRQNSEATSHEDPSTPTGSGLPHLARQRKEEEDMDEDERLLASEEGKKLSSKERRQLRNKVSARAFRSRRKEYIGQLEGEIAVKVKEADDLRSENDALKAENTRLTDLTRMLLSSSAFSTFLNDLSNSGGPLVNARTASSSNPTPAPQQQMQSKPRKDANPHQQNLQSQQQSNTQIGIALIPENTMDFAAFDPTSNAWAGNMDYGFNNAQVFSVMELPQEPDIDSIDCGILSGKSANSVGPYSSEEAKDSTPSIERMPIAERASGVKPECVKPMDDSELDESDPAFALFVDSPSPSQSKPTHAEEEYQVFGAIELEKAVARFDIIIDDDNYEDGIVSSAVMARFERMCFNLEVASSRIVAITSHL